MSGAFDLIIFDCDGTLIDSETLNNRACSQILTERGLTQYTPEYCITHFTGLSQPKIWRMVEAENNVTLPDINQQYIDRVTAFRRQGIQAAPGALALVKAVAATHKICVASNGERENVTGALAAAGLSAFFPPDHVFTASDVASPKPAPDLFLHAARTMGAAPDRTLVVEDSLAGVQAGLAAGMIVYAVTGLAHDPEASRRILQAAGVRYSGTILAGLLPLLADPQTPSIRTRTPS